MLLGIKSPLLKCSPQAADAHTRSGNAGNRTHPEMSMHTTGKMERNKAIIIHQRTRASILNFSVDLCVLTKEVQRLVNQVTAKIEKQATGFFLAWKFAPCTLAGHRSVTLKT